MSGVSDNESLKVHWQLIVQQNRSGHTQEALLDAAESLILEKGVDASAISEIAQRAGFSIGAVYHHFRDKKAIVFSLFERAMSGIEDFYTETEESEHWQDLTIRDLLRIYLNISVLITKDMMVAKTTAMAVAADHPEFAERFVKTMVGGRKIIYQAILDRRAKIGREDPEKAVGIILDQLSAMFAGYIDPARQAYALQPLDDKQFVEMGIQIASAFLKLDEEE